jgi:hypothetical protein
MWLGTLLEPEIDLHRLTEVLDGLGHEGRVDTIRQWDARTQARLYEAAKGYKPLTLDFFVPPSTSPLTEIIHWGKNSLPTLTHFQKRFCKLEEGADLMGYNHNDFPASWGGPGYFVVHTAKDEGEIDIDYTKAPPSKKPETWPTIVPNSHMISRFVYYDMIDVMRGLSEHVSIGRAFRSGKWSDNYFVLTREDPKAS